MASGGPVYADRAVLVHPRPERSTRGFWRALRRFVRAKPMGAAGLVILVLLLFCAVFAPLIAPHAPNTITSGGRLKPPSGAYPFGTDETARDVLSRIIWGSRLSLEVGFFSIALAIVSGGLLALWSGFAGGWIDLLIQRGIDVLMSLPPLVFALVIVAMLGPSVRNVVAGIAIMQLPGSVRVLRSAVLSVKAAPYIDSARATGASTRRLLFRHVLPNISAPIIVVASTSIGAAILIETALSFLGYGAPASVPSWGRMLSSARPFIVNQPWLGVFSGLAITLCVFSANVLGDALRDVLDPRLRGGR